MICCEVGNDFIFWIIFCVVNLVLFFLSVNIDNLIDCFCLFVIFVWLFINDVIFLYLSLGIYNLLLIVDKL